MSRVRTLAEVYRRFGEAGAAGTSPVDARVAVALGGSEEAMRAVARAPARRRRPALVLAALHDLALAGRAPALAAAHAAGDAEAAGRAAIDTLLHRTDAVVDTVMRRQLRSDETGRCAVLYPAVAEAAHRAAATTIGLIDVGRAAGLNLSLDRVALTYGAGRPSGDGPGRASGDGEARSLGDPASPVRMGCSMVGDRPVPARPVPEVVARIVVDRDPIDVTDPDDARWLRACLAPDRPDRAAGLDAEIALAATAPPLLLAGDPVEVLPAAIDRIPAGALPVVTTTWALSRFSVEARRRFTDRLTGAAGGRTVAWVSAEGVGVAPAVPTLGDRPASGHSIVGLALVEGSVVRAEAVGRCWSRGRLLAWLAEPDDREEMPGRS